MNADVVTRDEVGGVGFDCSSNQIFFFDWTPRTNGYFISYLLIVPF